MSSSSQDDQDTVGHPQVQGLEERKAYQELRERAVGFFMQVLITCVLLVAGLYLLMGSNDEASKRFGASFIGAIIGYWLR